MLLKLKITLKYIEPKIWRRVLIDSDRPLEDLHWVIQEIFEWDNDHLAGFRKGRDSYDIDALKSDLKMTELANRMRESMFGGGEKTDWLEALSMAGEEAETDEELLQIKDLISKPKDKLLYTYDYGDNWEHEIVVESLGKKDYSDLPEPLVLDGKRRGPMEDSGGVYGYTQKLKIMADPDHPEHEELAEWWDAKFDPEWFEVEEKNASLRHTFQS